MANRIFDGIQQEGTEGAVQGNFQHGHHGTQHIQRHLIGKAIQPLDDDTQVDVGLGDLIPFQHAPALHQRHFRIGVTLLFRMEVGVNLTQGIVRCLFCQCRKGAGSHVLDPHQIGHELFQLGPLFIRDQFGTGSVPIDVRQGPLGAFDFGQHFVQIDGSHDALLTDYSACGDERPQGPAHR